MLRNFKILATRTCNLYPPKRFAGHSKWANIRHIKGAKDAQRADLFLKLGRQMRVAIKEGGSPDPGKNPKLEQIIAQAKRFNMPVASINSVLKTAAATKDNCTSYILEIKGPGSCIILCEVFTDKLHVVKQLISTILRKTGGKYSDGGGRHLFEEKGVVETKVPKSVSNKTPEEIVEKATDDAIECGAEDVKVRDEGVLQWTCGTTNLRDVQNNLEKLGYVITSASVEFLPIKFQLLSDQEIDACAVLYQKLEGLPEVVKLSDNIA